MYNTEVLNLKSLEALNREVERLIPVVVKSLEDPTQKAKLTIILGFEMMDDSETALRVTTSVKPSFPSKARALIARRDLTGNLTADTYDLGIVDLPKQTTLKTTDGKSINDTQEDE